jgi:addiction module RelB/DinJ family antitoxin
MSIYISTFAVHKGGAAMPKNATITLRIEGKLKADSEQIFRRLGLTTTEAIKIFLSAVRNRRGIPFPVQLDEQRAEGAPLSADRKATLDAIMGKYADITPSEEFACIKQTEIDDEGRKLHP